MAWDHGRVVDCVQEWQKPTAFGTTSYLHLGHKLPLNCY